MPKLTPEEDLPNAVRAWRKRTINPATGRFFTLQEVAAKIGTSYAHLARIETGGRDLSIGWMERIARVMNCTPADLLGPENGGLSPEERKVIELLRKLPDANRRMVDAMLESQRAFLPDEAGAEVIDFTRKTG